MSQKSYDNSPTVYLIPTPIGNMQDITLRAIDTLKMVDVIFSEDTRVTRELLTSLNIDKKLISSHNFNESKNLDKLLMYLKNNQNVGIVTDRGTPIISDPGYELVKCAIENHYNVVGLPGPTALIPALITSGIDPSPFMFYGFLSTKSTTKELESLKDYPYTMIFYEAPHRINKTLKLMLQVFGDRKISISREISKKFEEIYRGNISQEIIDIKDAKGEMVVIVSGNKEKKDYSSLTIIEHVNLYIKEGYSKMDAMKMVAKDRGIAKSKVYDAYNRGEK
jgi:16S rRNA (cytidine1402-2'-O)-methyltransferase